MNLTKKNSLFFLTIFLLPTLGYLQAGVTVNKPLEPIAIENYKEKLQRLFEYDFSSKFKPGDSYYGRNISLLNSCIPQDRYFYMRHTLDFTLDVLFMPEDPAAEVRMSMRNRAVWGRAQIIPTTSTEGKVLEHVGLSHSHAIPRHISWLRELWLEFSLNAISGMEFRGNKQTFTLGAFPFKLGRGIALGDAFAVNPGYLGFAAEDAVDQYAFGLKLSGEIIKNVLTYDVYGAFLNNKSGSLGDTGAKIYAQEYGRRNCPERGFGILDLLFAGKLNWTAVNTGDNGILSFEPYFVTRIDKEQKLEFRGDSTSKLGTIGLACEYDRKRFGFGFDCAFNMGSQHLKGWDRNVITLQNMNGKLAFVNSHVYVNVDPCSEEAKTADMKAYRAPQASITSSITNVGLGNGTLNDFQIVPPAPPVPQGATFNDGNTQLAVPTDPIALNQGGKLKKELNKTGKNAQSIINLADRGGCFNGLKIGKIEGFSDSTCVPSGQDPANHDVLFNAKNRFRDPYSTIFKGYMFVADAALFFMDQDVRLAATVGYASGDADPNFIQKDGDFQGFIPLQSIYNGKRVKSAFYLGGHGKLRLPLDSPTTEERPYKFARRVAGMTNLGFVGTGINWKPHTWKKPFELNPNILAFWQPWPDRKFDALNKIFLKQQAHSFLGIEINVYAEKELLTDLKIYAVWAIFMPGRHFDDVRGKPLNASQWALLDRLDRTGYNEDRIPNLGRDNAIIVNLGFDYKF